MTTKVTKDEIIMRLKGVLEIYANQNNWTVEENWGPYCHSFDCSWTPGVCDYGYSDAQLMLDWLKEVTDDE